MYVAENGCKWRVLSKEYGNWHRIYVILNRWSKNKVLERLFIGLQKERIINVKMEALSIDSTTVKVHPHVTRSIKKGRQSRRNTVERFSLRLKRF